MVSFSEKKSHNIGTVDKKLKIYLLLSKSCNSGRISTFDRRTVSCVFYNCSTGSDIMLSVLMPMTVLSYTGRHLQTLS